MNFLNFLHQLGVIRWLHEPQLKQRTLSWGFHTVWSGFGPEDQRLGPRFVRLGQI